MTDKVTTMVLKVDLCCPRCCKKIKDILAKFCQIQTQAYDVKQNTVTITIVCSDPEEFRDKLRCKGGKIIQSIEIKEPPPPEKKTPKNPENKPEKPEKMKLVLVGCGTCYGCCRGGPCSQVRCGTSSGCTCGGSCSQVRCGTCSVCYYGGICFQVRCGICSGCCRGGPCYQGCRRPGPCYEYCNEEKTSICTFM